MCWCAYKDHDFTKSDQIDPITYRVFPRLFTHGGICRPPPNMGQVQRDKALMGRTHEGDIDVFVGGEGGL